MATRVVLSAAPCDKYWNRSLHGVTCLLTGAAWTLMSSLVWSLSKSRKKQNILSLELERGSSDLSTKPPNFFCPPEWCNLFVWRLLLEGPVFGPRTRTSRVACLNHTAVVAVIVILLDSSPPPQLKLSQIPNPNLFPGAWMGAARTAKARVFSRCAAESGWLCWVMCACCRLRCQGTLPPSMPRLLLKPSHPQQ